MSLSQHVFLYCERGSNEALFAEPLNAASNASFLLAALAALLLLLRRPREMRSADHYLFIALVFLIGLGSLAFHLLADGASLLADVVPIDVFMLVYLGFALNRRHRLPRGRGHRRIGVPQRQPRLCAGAARHGDRGWTDGRA